MTTNKRFLFYIIGFLLQCLPGVSVAYLLAFGFGGTGAVCGEYIPAYGFAAVPLFWFRWGIFILLSAALFGMLAYAHSGANRNRGNQNR